MLNFVIWYLMGIFGNFTPWSFTPVPRWGHTRSGGSPCSAYIFGYFFDFFCNIKTISSCNIKTILLLYNPHLAFIFNDIVLIFVNSAEQKKLISDFYCYFVKIDGFIDFVRLWNMYIIKQTSWANCSNFVNFCELGQFPGLNKVDNARSATS